MPDNAVAISDTTFRDGHQSLMATRLRTKIWNPLQRRWTKSVSIQWKFGGVQLSTLYKVSGEDPWERLRTFKGLITNTPYLCS
ncbi:MAG: hypothetical protein CM1200mP3_03000 [Chloroflexota bacterium]|nr:MAG: hypothetical protein CM1200mP3_03000 [Chloroflexota bacterium]